MLCFFAALLNAFAGLWIGYQHNAWRWRRAARLFRSMRSAGRVYQLVDTTRWHKGEQHHQRLFLIELQRGDGVWVPATDVGQTILIRESPLDAANEALRMERDDFTVRVVPYRVEEGPFNGQDDRKHAAR